MVEQADQYLRGLVGDTTQLAGRSQEGSNWFFWIGIVAGSYLFIAITAKFLVWSKEKDDPQRQSVDKFCLCWPELCVGRAAFRPYNFIFLPALFVVHWFRIYVWELFAIYTMRLSWRLCCCCSSYYTDTEFPAGPGALGAVSGDTANESGGKDDNAIEWKRLGDFGRKGEAPSRPKIHDTPMQLFCGEIEAGDVCQGALGDCWLLAAMAILAEREGAIDDIFVTKEVSPGGKYVVKIMDLIKKEWVTITVDDYVPCKRGYTDPKTGMPLQVYSQCHGYEVWACILEKVFAKFCGSYHAIEAGHTEWGLMAMTGKQAFRYMKSKQDADADAWLRIKITPTIDEKDPSDKRHADFAYDHNVKHDSDQLWEILRLYKRNGAVMCVQGTSKDGADMGLVQGHAFSILSVHEVYKTMTSMEVFRLVEIRNPWGQGTEWTGAWSDDSEEWKKYSHVKSALGEGKGSNDGIFWMCWEDVVKYWESIGVVDMDYDIMDLKLPLYNDQEVTGPCKAFLQGTCEYLCCKGLKHLMVAREAEENEPEIGEDHCCGADPTGIYCCHCFSKKHARSTIKHGQ